jgi:hypothetical protein
MNVTIENVELWVGALAAIAALAAWGLRKWKAMNADGKITLDEIIDTVKEGEEKVKETAEVVEEAIEKTE